MSLQAGEQERVELSPLPGFAKAANPLVAKASSSGTPLWKVLGLAKDPSLSAVSPKLEDSSASPKEANGAPAAGQVVAADDAVAEPAVADAPAAGAQPIVMVVSLDPVAMIDALMSAFLPPGAPELLSNAFFDDYLHRPIADLHEELASRSLADFAFPTLDIGILASSAPVQPVSAEEVGRNLVQLGDTDASGDVSAAEAEGVLVPKELQVETEAVEGGLAVRLGFTEQSPDGSFASSWQTAFAVAPEQADAFREQLRTLDPDGDGRVKAAELFKAIDADGNGRASAAEAAALVSSEELGRAWIAEVVSSSAEEADMMRQFKALAEEQPAAAPAAAAGEEEHAVAAQEPVPTDAEDGPAAAEGSGQGILRQLDVADCRVAEDAAYNAEEDTLEWPAEAADEAAAAAAEAASAAGPLL